MEQNHEAFATLWQKELNVKLLIEQITVHKQARGRERKEEKEEEKKKQSNQVNKSL